MRMSRGLREARGRSNPWHHTERIMVEKNLQRNYARELEQQIQKNQQEGRLPRLLLHACCAPCSSYCLEYLREYFDITVFFYNPNITETAEYQKRVEEIKRLIGEYNDSLAAGDFSKVHGTPSAHPVHFLEGRYDPAADFLVPVRGLEQEPEGGARCTKCFEQRLSESARVSAEEGFDCFTTTLTISPLKDAHRLNRIGEEMAGRYGTQFLPSDFKKKNGYKRSTELSKLYDLYRQDYCGCAFSKAEREQQKLERGN